MTETPTGPTQGIYRERAHLVALLAALYPSHIGYTDPNEPDWAVVIVEAPGGQLSWHIAPGDMDLFGHVRPTNRICRGWDGHSTDEKYRRIRELAATTEPFPLPALTSPVWLTRDVSAVTAKPLTGELFAEILGHVPNCRYGCVACEASPTLVAEIRRLRGERGDLAAKLAAATETVVKLAATRDTYAALLLTVDEIAYDKPVEFICGLLRQAMHAHFCGCPHPLQNQVFCARFPGHAGCHADGQQRWVPTVSAVEPQPESSP